MWLDEIEEDIEIELEVQMADAQRMARVLRELEGYCKSVKALEIEMFEHTVQLIKKKRNKLSDDAKELLR